MPRTGSKAMPHIVHLTTVHLPFDTRIFEKECRALVQAGYRVSLVAPHTTQEVVDGVEVIPIPRFKRRLARITRVTWAMAALYQTARRLHADVYHFHDPELMPVGILLKKRTHAAVIYDVHENYPTNLRAKEWLAGPLRRIAPWTAERLENITAIVVDGIVAATDHIAKRFPADKTRVVKNYPLLTAMWSSGGAQRLYDGNHALVYTGGLTDHRGISQIVQALGHVRNSQARLLLLGGHVHRETAQTVQSLPGWQRVDYQGQVAYRTMYEYLGAAAVGLVCNQPVYDYDQALPNKLFEYMSAGLPVIASNFPDWVEIVAGNECGVTVDPTSPEEIAEAIDYLLDHSDIRRRMGENGRHAISEKYNWERESLNLLDLYREVLGEC
jgi:glycosyltransferase involved in cell wall biosynthesis